MRSRVLVSVLTAWATMACSSESAKSGDDAAAPDASGDVVQPAVDASIGDVVTSTDVALDPFDDRSSFNDCSPFDFTMNDHTAAGDARIITFSYDQTPVQYAPRCMKIKVGQTVTWKGDQHFHPLSPAGGDIPTPITDDPNPMGTQRAIAFPNAGFFGFECFTHEAPAEYGAILVVP